VDLIAFCCTASTVIMGPNYDMELISKIESETRIPCTTTTRSILKALRQIKARKLSMISPYGKKIEELEINYFSKCGFEILRAKGMDLGVHELDKPSPKAIYEFASKEFDHQADCLLISCLNFRAQACIEALEKDLGRPVISSAQAVMWNILRRTGVNETIDGYGSLLNPD
jgi:maleate isomerase